MFPNFSSIFRYRQRGAERPGSAGPPSAESSAAASPARRPSAAPFLPPTPNFTPPLGAEPCPRSEFPSPSYLFSSGLVPCLSGTRGSASAALSPVASTAGDRTPAAAFWSSPHTPAAARPAPCPVRRPLNPIDIPPRLDRDLSYGSGSGATGGGTCGSEASTSAVLPGPEADWGTDHTPHPFPSLTGVAAAVGSPDAVVQDFGADSGAQPWNLPGPAEACTWPVPVQPRFTTPVAGLLGTPLDDPAPVPAFPCSVFPPSRRRGPVAARDWPKVKET